MMKSDCKGREEKKNATRLAIVETSQRKLLAKCLNILPCWLR